MPSLSKQSNLFKYKSTKVRTTKLVFFWQRFLNWHFCSPSKSLLCCQCLRQTSRHFILTWREKKDSWLLFAPPTEKKMTKEGGFVHAYSLDKKNATGLDYIYYPGRGLWTLTPNFRSSKIYPNLIGYFKVICVFKYRGLISWRPSHVQLEKLSICFKA